MKPADAAPLLPGLVAALTARRARIEEIVARPSAALTPGALHDLRVALRRTAAFARLTRGVPVAGDGDALRIAARDLRRSLSVRRTKEVSAAKLLARFRRDARRRDTAARLARSIAAQAPRDEGSFARIRSARLASLRRAFAQRDAELGRLNHPLSGSFDSRVEKRLRRKIGKRLAARRKRLLAFGVPSAETLHPTRIAAKELRYGLELARESMAGAPALIDALRAFQTASGDAHDRAELIDEVRRHAGKVSAPRRRDSLRLLPVLMRDADRSLGRTQAVARRLMPLLERTPFTWA